MDSACYDSTNGKIYGVRGGRVFECDPLTGAIVTSKDYAQPGFGIATCCYESGTDSIFASCWNAPVFTNDSPSNTSAPRFIYKIRPSDLAVIQTIDFNSVLGVANATLAFTQLGVADLKSRNGFLFGRIIKNGGGAVQPGMGGFSFKASDLSSPDSFFDTSAGYPKCAVGLAGLDVTMFVTDQQEQGFNIYNFQTSTFTNGPMEPDDTKIMMAIEYAQNKVFVSDQAQFIHVYDNTGVFIITLNTARTAFNGLGMRYNSVDNLVYVAGGGDNRVCTVNATTNAITVLPTTFDMPIDFVFTPSKVFAVQLGSTPLKEVV